jgi:hypothetical protein
LAEIEREADRLAELIEILLKPASRRPTSHPGEGTAREGSTR